MLPWHIPLILALGFARAMAEVLGQLLCRDFSILTLTLTLAVTPSPNHGLSPSPSPSPIPCPIHDPSTQAGCLHCVDLLWFQYPPLMLLFCVGKRCTQEGCDKSAQGGSGLCKGHGGGVGAALMYVGSPAS